MSSSSDRPLPDGADVTFAEIGSAPSGVQQDGRSGPQARALSATVVTVGPDHRLNEAADVLERLRERTAVRSILISVGAETRPIPRRIGDTVALSGLKPSFVNNAVAALRLSSLPTMVWWRGGRPDVLEELSHLADRIVLDDESVLNGWKRAADLFEEAAFTDLRWTRLTRWRTLMANFFDIPEVRAASSRFDRLRITSADPAGANLFAAWLSTSLGRPGSIGLEVVESGKGAFIEAIHFGGGKEGLSLQLVPSGTCVMTSAQVQDHRGARRTAPLGDQSLPALMAEELRIRAHDRAFEAAVRACLSTVGHGGANGGTRQR